MTSAVCRTSTPEAVKSPHRIVPTVHETGSSDGTFMAGPFSQGPEICLTNPRPDQHTAPSTPPATSSVTAPFVRPDDSRTEPHKLSSIASAGLRTSPSPAESRKKTDSPHSMATASSSERPFEPDRPRSATQSNLQTAQAALGVMPGGADGQGSRQDKPDGAPSRNPSMEVDSASLRRPSHETRRPSNDRRLSPSPMSMPDGFGNGDNHAGNPQTLINSSTVASPGPIEENRPSEERSHQGDNEPADEGNKSFSYPVPLPTTSHNGPRRGMSMPHTGFHKANSRSPGSKKHQCPYCSTEFTRQHNLKSHLLTHSHEKPYVCQTCQSRFRRLHDLKRHTKLHTGERPHLCPKCGRRFARGDALARHTKGSGGCAGRRSSMGSFAGGDDEYEGHGAGGGEDAMEGLMYTEPERIDEEEERNLTLPSIRRPGSPSDPQSQASSGRHVSFQSQAPSTYPPLGINRPPQGGLFPPVSTQPGSGSSASPISPGGNFSFPSGTSGSSTYASAQQHGSSPSMLAQTPMTESPKPLSPSGMSSRQLGHGPEGNHQRQHSNPHARSHSPGTKSQQPHQQQYGGGRGSQGSGTGLGIPPTLNLPAPQSGAPQLPPPPGMNPPDPRYTLQTPQSQAPTRSPLISPALSPGRHDQQQQPQQHTQLPHHTHNRSSTDTHNANDATTTTTPNANSNNNVYSQHRQASPQRQHSNSNAGLSPVSATSDNRLWGYVKALEDRMGGLEAEVGRLREQLAAAHAAAGNGGENHGSAVANGS